MDIETANDLMSYITATILNGIEEWNIAEGQNFADIYHFVRGVEEKVNEFIVDHCVEIPPEERGKP